MNIPYGPLLVVEDVPNVLELLEITRTERLLTTLQPDQRPAFEALLQQAKDERDEIQGELDHIYQILDEFKRSQK